MLTVGNGPGEYFQSPGYIFKYGNLSKNSQKIAKEIIENWRICSLVVMSFKNTFRVQGGHSNLVTSPKRQKNHRKLEAVPTGGDVIREYVRLEWTFKYGNISKNSHKIAEIKGTDCKII